MGSRTFWIIISLGTLVASCGDIDANPRRWSNAPVCYPDVTRPCLMPTGVMGVQVCTEFGYFDDAACVAQGADIDASMMDVELDAGAE